MFPVFDDVEPDVLDGYAATAVGVDVVFEDGARLSDGGAPDQYGVPVDPRSQYEARMLAVDQWSSRTIVLRGWAGRTVDRVELIGWVPARADGDHGDRQQHGYVDRIDIVAAAGPPRSPVEAVRTTRGTFSSDRFSRGGCAPWWPFRMGLSSASR